MKPLAENLLESMGEFAVAVDEMAFDKTPKTFIADLTNEINIVMAAHSGEFLKKGLTAAGIATYIADKLDKQLIGGRNGKAYTALRNALDDYYNPGDITRDGVQALHDAIVAKFKY